MIKILKLQALATLQDLGRYGYRRLGIGHCGAMDKLALQAGNLLLENAEDDCAIEVALGGITVRFEQDSSFCITGALYEAYLDGESVYSYWRYSVKKGQILQLVKATYGMYGYLCVQGGIQVKPELASRSTDLKAQFGGLNGRALQEGDELPFRDKTKMLSHLGIAPIPFSDTIRALPSSEYQAFSRKSQYYWWQNRWHLQSNSNRMGYRFKGDTLELIKPLEMLSHGVQFGTIQVPPSGQPIVLMADSQTTGGYPKIASVIQADLGKLAQVRLGSQIKFECVTPEQAVKLQQKNTAYLNQIRRIVDAAR
ncbi:hypothetical protein BMT54_00200 [Pasteurellaceae bacterium 15-036681]|nr:hypothetical protein BMT54_00200 [Pasteurellaceae bacterium 15-036681]